jgi:secretion/DNA translocation related TadE-like protein
VSPADRREHGAGSVLLLAAISMIVVAVLATLTLGAGQVARRGAADAADLAALAAASEVGRVGGDPCAAAERVSRLNGADLRECAVDGWEVEVVVSVPASGPLRWLDDPARRARAGAALSTHHAGPGGAGQWVVPVAGTHRITARFGDTGPWWDSGRHTGLDFAAPVGTAVVASAPGRVARAGPAGRYGNLVVVDHGGAESYYAHLASIAVRPGDIVAAGQRLGAVGATGNATGPHLHFEVRIGGVPHDPARVLSLVP